MSKQMKFKGDRRWWTVRAADERFTILTRQREFHPRAEVVYTIIDRERGVRGPCNAIGQGWDFNVDTLDADAALLLEALNLDAKRAAWADAHPESRTRITEPYIGSRIDYPPELAEGHAVEVSYRNNVPIQIEAER